MVHLGFPVPVQNSIRLFLTTVSARLAAALHLLMPPRPSSSHVYQPQTEKARLGKLSSLVPGLSLSARFAFAATIVLCNAMALLGGWVVSQIENGLERHAARSESAYVQTLFSPVLSLIASHGKDPAEIGRAVEEQLRLVPLWSSIAIWQSDGSILYRTDTHAPGGNTRMPREVTTAFSGEVVSSYQDRRLRAIYPEKHEPATRRTIYAPLHHSPSGEIIAVVEIVINADAFTAQLDSIRTRTWLVVGLTTLIMIGVLFSIVHRGSRRIEEQQEEITRRLDEEIRLKEINAELRERLEDANRRGIELGERQLRRNVTDLENGPVQLLALALLRMYELKPASSANDDAAHAREDVVNVITQATTGALREIREIAAGLSLPELERISSYEALERAVRAHEQATGTVVEMNFGSCPQHLPLPVTICLFRVVQEGLANAYMHAGARGQSVTCSSNESSVIVTVSDEGPGFSAEEALTQGSNLGLRRLQQLVESIAGKLIIQSSKDGGTQLIALFPDRGRPQTSEAHH